MIEGKYKNIKFKDNLINYNCHFMVTLMIINQGNKYQYYL